MNKKQTHDEPSVSILTITQYSRRKCLTNLSELIKQQEYCNIIEWVIVDGSHHSADAIANEKYIIAQWKTLALLPFNLEIIYIPFVKKQHLSDLRNTGNNVCPASSCTIGSVNSFVKLLSSALSNPLACE